MHQNLNFTNVAKTDFDTDLICSSNMIFCVATDLVSAIQMSTKIPTFLEEVSIERILFLLQ